MGHEARKISRCVSYAPSPRLSLRSILWPRSKHVSADEKEELFRGLKRQSWQISLVALVLAGCIAGALMTGLIETNAKVQWFQISSILMVAVLAVIAIHGRDRLASRILGNRSPDVPRLPIRQALTRSRRPIGKQYAVPVLWSAAILLGLAMGTVDATIVYLVFAVAKELRRFGDSGFLLAFSTPSCLRHSYSRYTRHV